MNNEINNCPFCGSHNISAKGTKKYICGDCKAAFSVSKKQQTPLAPLPGQMTLFDLLDGEGEHT